MASKKQSREDRDGRGRFAAGNPGGPGGARRRACAFKAAVESAVTEEHLQALMRRAVRMGLEGDLGAIRFVHERLIGKPANTPYDEVELELPPLRTTKDCSRAIDIVIEAATTGRIDAQQAQLLLDAINTKLRSIEQHELEERIARIEEAAEHVPKHPHR